MDQIYTFVGYLHFPKLILIEKKEIRTYGLLISLPVALQWISQHTSVVPGASPFIPRIFEEGGTLWLTHTCWHIVMISEFCASFFRFWCLTAKQMLILATKTKQRHFIRLLSKATFTSAPFWWVEVELLNVKGGPFSVMIKFQCIQGKLLQCCNHSYTMKIFTFRALFGSCKFSFIFNVK